MIKRHQRLATCAVITLSSLWPSISSGADSSPPVILQWFENSWSTMEKRAPDVFMAGYGSVWTPPPGRAMNTAAGGGIGYDVYDRFDLGTARDATMYGTLKGYQTMIKEQQKSGGNVYVDYVHHHVGSFDVTPVPSGAPTVQTRNDYPGFVLSTPNSNPSFLDGDTYQPNTQASVGQAAWEYQFRLANLITINFTSSNNNVLVRNPVTGFINNVPQSSANWAVPTATIDSNNNVINSTVLRQANTPNEANRGFYTDMQGPSRTVVDGGTTYTVHDFNLANPSAGDPTAENSAGYMMRYAQWLVQVVGVDGLRIDAARHVPLGASGDQWNPTQVDVPKLIDRAVAGASNRTNLDGTKRSVFQFQEVYSGDTGLLQSFIRKSAASGDTTNPNRDVLDFPMWFAMRDNLSSNDGQNNWYNIRNASQDVIDDGLSHNGSQAVHFVNNHDSGGVTLSNVAHAYMMMQPGNAYVYFKGDEFKRSQATFLTDGRGDALGGQYGTIITKLNDIRNSYGRGNFAERYIDGGGSSGFSNVYAFERVGSSIVGLSSFNNGAGVTSFDGRTMYCAFTPGTRLIELTGNAADAQVDPNNQIPELIVVQNTDNASLGSGKVTLNIPRNQNVNGVSHGKGYVIYGLPRPVGSVSVSNVASTIAAEAQSASDNSTGRITAVDVITANSFNLSLNTTKVQLSDGFHDTYADGDRAMFKVNEGLDLNGNGVVDNTNSNFAFSTVYGFENFVTTNLPGYNQASGNGTYSQTISTTGLPEGYNYITVRAWRHQGATESEIYTDLRKVIYVDRFKPQSAVAGSAQYGANDTTRDFQVTSTDKTANSVHVLLDLPATLTDSQVLSLLTSGNHATQIDRDLFSLINTNTSDGNHVMTVVSYELSGNYNIQRFPGQRTITSAGLGFGDMNHDNTYQPSDITSFGVMLGSNNTTFDAAADVTGDGLVDNNDMTGLRSNMLTADSATQSSYQALYNARINVNSNWNQNASGTWSTMNNWTTVAPNSNAAVANFTSVITAPKSVTIDAPQTVSAITFNNTNKYTLAGSSTLSINSATTGSITVSGGSHEITAPLALNVNTTFALTTGTSLKVTNLLPSTKNISKTAPGTLQVNSINTTGTVTVSGGVLDVIANGTSAGVLNAGKVTANDGKIDLHDNDLISNYGATSNYTATVFAVKHGLTLLGGAGNIGIGSTEVDNQTVQGTMLAVVDDGDANINGAITALSGFNIPNPTTSTLVKFTWFGDSNLDGSVDGSDYALLDSGFTSGGSLGGWVFGDYDYSGSVDGSDYALIDTGFISQSGVLPEPATIGLLGLGAIGLLRRNRKSE